MAHEGYDPQRVENKWQRVWQERRLYETDLDAARRPFYNMVEFPYPSAEGLHVGHFYSYGGADTYGRYWRMQGYDVFQPMGFDAFGMHSENYALKLGMSPAVLVPRNIRRFREQQLQRMGAAFDWSRQVDTTDPYYYRWTQWIFVQLYKAGLAYRATRPVNWCPSCLTTLASEQVLEGRCERCATPVTQRELTQWFFRITDYAEELLDFSGADLPEITQVLQRNWIGRKEGAEVTFRVVPRGMMAEQQVTVFSTRADTLYGATFLVLAPEHPLVPFITDTAHRIEVDAYIKRTQQRSEVERLSATETKTGVFTGALAVNPVDGRQLPVWVADYVLMGFGTGAIFATPAHDARDWDFAHAYGLPILNVVQPVEAADDTPLSQAYEGEGLLINSGPYDGLTTAEARAAIVADLAERGLGRQTVSYRLHDWTISRQRYWGPPIPMIYCHTCGEVPVPEADLPVRLPATENFRPLGTGASPLGAIPEFVQTTCPRCGGPARRETDVSDNFLDSAWYFLRYTSTEHNDRPWDVERLKRWLPVTFYAGGAEHSTMHHLYARFLWRALQDLGHLPRALGREPFARLRLHGMIIKDGAKMSKSRGNVVVPDAYVTRYGADVLRLYMEFMGPFERGGDFRDDGINGMVRLANRIWRLALVQPAEGHDANAAEALTRAMHRAIRKVTLDIEALSFNTAISTIMVYVNALSDAHGAVGLVQWKESLLTLIKLLAPFAPHLAEELWERLGQPFSVHRQPWPTFDEALAEEEQITLVAQVNGKLRDRLTAPVGLDERAARELVLTSEAVQRALEGATIRRVIHVPDRLVNIVTG